MSEINETIYDNDHSMKFVEQEIMFSYIIIDKIWQTKRSWEKIKNIS